MADSSHQKRQSLDQSNNKELDLTEKSISQGNSSHDAEPQEPVDPNTALEQTVTTESTKYPPMAKILLIMLSLYVSMFLIALDRLIIATATPKITDEFHSLNDIGWYGSAFMLTSAASQLIYGRIYTFYPAKWVFLCSVLIFEVGSAVCGAAPSSVAFIIGRAVAGLRYGRHRLGNGIGGVMFGIASVLGPILGGVFTTNVSWRWCFYINLPFGGVAMVMIFILLDVPPPVSGHFNLKQKLNQLDPLGNLFLIPCVICLLLALEWGGASYAWGNWRIILLFVLFGVLLILFIGWQIKMGERALVPPRIFKQRSVLAGFLWTACMNAGMMVVLYYLPIWFQAIKDVDAEQSGIMNLPLVLSMVVGSVGSGILISALGYYNPFMYACVVLISIGMGLMTTFTPSTGHPKWIGYQVIFGFGLGLGMQQANVAVQTCLKPTDVPVGASLLMFSQQLNGALFTAIAQTLFGNFLRENLRKISGINVDHVVKLGATGIRQGVPASKMGAVIEGYSDAITRTFILGVVMGCLSVFPAYMMEWKSVRKDHRKKEKKQDTEAQA
ncbi:hypothetical protein N7468_002028 [Penicillium chermesinum]|uniref:Uncharacterized protein n=1 Tax=Penicillium chermesinum TaxID=63820 RepID=A0A9W9TX76_9EURO|nr:uncharacterized protein N7468_002028 [Penicillium chermesinum]KAJ5247045.1 hypothetical protein N7468_002028 [Penicillium chermesinum]